MHADAIRRADGAILLADVAEAGRGGRLHAAADRAVPPDRRVAVEEARLRDGVHRQVALGAGLDAEQRLRRDERSSGSAALDLCYVASGRFEAFWEFNLNPWDFAAGKLIVEEAGGKVTDKEGKKLTIFNSYVVASNKKIHPLVLKVLN